MIVHASIPSTRPQEIARFLAKVIDAEVFPFHAVPGSWIAVPRDGSGHAIEVYPLGTVAKPGDGSGDVRIEYDPSQTMASAHHLAITTKLNREQILDLASEMGFRGVACERSGIFGVIEVWIENQFMIEVVTEPELKRYMSAVNPESIKRKFGSVS